MSKGLQLLLDSNRGIYIPRDFVNEMDLSQIQGIRPKDIDICQDTENAWYWEAWERILQDATYTDEGGHIWTLHHDGELWLICEELMTRQEKRDFFGLGYVEEEEEDQMLFTGVKIWENGTQDERSFEAYEALCAWLAESPEAGITAYQGENTIDHRQLQEDVERFI